MTLKMLLPPPPMTPGVAWPSPQLMPATYLLELMFGLVSKNDVRIELKRTPAVIGMEERNGSEKAKSSASTISLPLATSFAGKATGSVVDVNLKTAVVPRVIRTLVTTAVLNRTPRNSDSHP